MDVFETIDDWDCQRVEDLKRNLNHVTTVKKYCVRIISEFKNSPMCDDRSTTIREIENYDKRINEIIRTTNRIECMGFPMDNLDINVYSLGCISESLRKIMVLCNILKDIHGLETLRMEDVYEWQSKANDIYMFRHEAPCALEYIGRVETLRNQDRPVVTCDKNGVCLMVVNGAYIPVLIEEVERTL